MTTYALVNPSDAIDRTATGIDPNVETKSGWRWLAIEDAGAPPHNRELATASSELVFRAGQVVRDWLVLDRPIDDQKGAIKREARRRILARYPDWKQTNMTARAVELLRKGEPNWTAEEAAEAAALQAVCDWIKTVRIASDVLEATTPIPSDFTDNRYWPV